jgi:hypothetical protein
MQGVVEGYEIVEEISQRPILLGEGKVQRGEMRGYLLTTASDCKKIVGMAPELLPLYPEG